MTTCIRRTTWPAACIALAVVMLASTGAFAMADGHVGGPGFQTTPAAPVATVGRLEL